MAIFQDGTKLWMYKGDTGNIEFTGLPKDKAYTVYFSVYDPESGKILKEIIASSYNQVTGTATVVINEDASNALKVGDFAYGLKGCASGSEDTWIPETKLEDGSYIAQEAPVFSVIQMVAEGS